MDCDMQLVLSGLDAALSNSLEMIENVEAVADSPEQVRAECRGAYESVYSVSLILRALIQKEGTADA